jgi:hypothetical protein
MSNYTKSTNFATKDSLSSGNPLKIVKGTEINTEFDNIQTAIATKADLVSPTFTGTPLAPTASTSTSTTQLATTAFVQAVAQTLFPVGAIYTATVSTNPATLLGFGTWTAFGAGRTIIGNGGGFSAGATGGSADAIVVSHTHTATSTVTDPTHQHSVARNGFNTSGTTAGGFAAFTYDGNNNAPTATTAVSTGITVATSNASTGSSGTNANLPPYIVVYMWTRTA